VISAAHHAIILKAETAIDRREWMAKLLVKAQGGKGTSPVKVSSNGSTPTMRTSLSDGSLVCAYFFLYLTNITKLDTELYVYLDIFLDFTGYCCQKTA
jgi:hypothetical protein